MKLKSILTLVIAAAGITFGFHANAADDHDHDHGKVGPTGGKLLTEVEPHAEFLVTKERKVEIRFVDDANKVTAPGTQVVTVTMGKRSSPTVMKFTKDGDKLVSDKAVPEGNDHPTVVQFQADAKSKKVNSKFNLNLNKCPTCENAEYACTCEHEHADGDHDKAKDKDKDKKAEEKK